MNRNQRWFFWTHFDANCHWPYGAPPQFIDLYRSGNESFNPAISSGEIQQWNDHSKQLDEMDLRRIEAVYSAEVSCIDRQIEMVVNQLKRQGLLENTVVLITSDHGELLGKEGFVGHGQNAKENLLHVPLMIYPGGAPDIPAGIRLEDTVESVDLAPTILEFCGVSAQTLDFDGESLIPLLRDNLRSKRTAYGEVSSSDVRMFHLTLKKGEFRLYWNSGQNRFSLYEFRRDPDEILDVIEQYPELAKELKLEILRLSGKEDFFGLIPETPKDLDPEMKERLRALGYIK